MPVPARGGRLRTPTDWKRRGDAGRASAAATPPSGASGCSASARCCCRPASSPSCCSRWSATARAASPRPRSRLPIDFPHSALILDPAALARRRRRAALAGADLEGVVAAAADARVWRGRRAAVLRRRLARACATRSRADPDDPRRPRRALAARRDRRSISPPRATATAAAERGLSRGSNAAGAIRDRLQLGLPDRRRRHRSRRWSASGARSRARC